MKSRNRGDFGKTPLFFVLNPPIINIYLNMDNVFNWRNYDMKQVGYTFIFLLFVIIVIPLILVKSCTYDHINNNVSQKVPEILHTVKVYIAEEDNVVEMNFNEYLKGVLAAEMPASFHMEALKAQAVAARTYTYHKKQSMEESGEAAPEHKGADICTNPSHCKAWISKDEAMDKWGILSSRKYWNKISEAVDGTSNIIMTYENEPIDAVFHSTSSGRTENSEDVWSNAIAYLRSVESPGEELSPKYTSVIQVSEQEFKEKLKTVRPEINFPEDISNIVEGIEHTQGGSVKNIRVAGCDFKGTEIRNIFGLNSSNFTIEMQDGNVVFHVKGNGHGVGMSQYGANYLAQQGKNYEEILKHYYQGVDIIKMEN